MEYEDKEKITLEEFWNSKKELFIHCETEEQAKALSKVLNRWDKKLYYLGGYMNALGYYGSVTCYSNNYTCKNIDVLKDRGAKIYEFKDVILPEEPKCEFKVGDRVQFKTWEEMKEVFGAYLENEDGFLARWIKPLCGIYATVEYIDYSYVGKLDGDDFVVGLCDFSEYRPKDSFLTCMLKPAVNEPKVNEQKWTFMENEKVILRNVDKKYKWLVRDANGQLYIYEQKPEKRVRFHFWRTIIPGNYNFNFFNHLFQTIRWEDKEPCEFRKYI